MQNTALRPIVKTGTASGMFPLSRSTSELSSVVTTLPLAQFGSDPFRFETCNDETSWALEEVDVVYEPRNEVIWQYMRPRSRPSFTRGLIHDLNMVADSIEATFARCAHKQDKPARFVVTASRVEGIFNLGGDLGLFLHLIEAKSRDALRQYAHGCARGQFRLHSNYHVPVCMVALVQGDALGGGFEAILAHDVVVAERQAQFGLPEVLFNLFPGMGAYTFLTRRVGAVQAERMILSGKIYSAEELHDLGIVDQLAATGEGVEAVYELMQEFTRQRHSREAVLKARKIVNRVTLEELIEIADVWVDAALQLSDADLRRMSHLAKAQDRRWARLNAQQSDVAVGATRQGAGNT